jgi:hypothetical protein
VAVFAMAEIFTDEALRPFLLKQIMATGFRVRKPVIEFNLVFEKVLGNREICHGRFLCLSSRLS